MLGTLVQYSRYLVLSWVPSTLGLTRAEWKNHLLWPADHTSFDAAQDTVESCRLAFRSALLSAIVCSLFLSQGLPSQTRKLSKQGRCLTPGMEVAYPIKLLLTGPEEGIHSCQYTKQDSLAERDKTPDRQEVHNHNSCSLSLSPSHPPGLTLQPLGWWLSTWNSS